MTVQEARDLASKSKTTKSDAHIKAIESIIEQSAKNGQTSVTIFLIDVRINGSRYAFPEENAENVVFHLKNRGFEVRLYDSKNYLFVSWMP